MVRPALKLDVLEVFVPTAKADVERSDGRFQAVTERTTNLMADRVLELHQALFARKSPMLDKPDWT